MWGDKKKLDKTGTDPDLKRLKTLIKQTLAKCKCGPWLDAEPESKNYFSLAIKDISEIVRHLVTFEWDMKHR